MTSDDTDARTKALLKKHSNFGMAADQITILKQDKVPSIEDNDGHIALADDGYGIQTKPHGHGDVHSVLYGGGAGGTVAKWVEGGFTHLFIFQDTNFFAVRTCLIGLGIGVDNDFDMNSMCVPRKPGEAIGCICQLEGAGKDTLTINVEYNQIDALLKETGTPEGDAEDPATPGFSAWPGNINELIFKLSTYKAALDESRGNVPEFINPKYTDGTKTKFKSPTRLECMMQDFPRTPYMKGKKVGFTSVDRKYVRQYSPVKNNVDDAAIKQASGLDPACACAGEMDVYRFFCDYLNANGKGMSLPEPTKRTFTGIVCEVPPMAVLHPSFVLQAPTSVVGGSLSAKSTLIVEGTGKLTLENVVVDGALVITVAEGANVTLKDLKVDNAGWAWPAVATADLLLHSPPIPQYLTGVSSTGLGEGVCQFSKG